MNPNPLRDLKEFGQSVWCDYIRRNSLSSGEIREMVEAGEVTGITSNPTIFDKAISKSADYDEAILAYKRDHPDASVQALYEFLITEDIRIAADLLRHVYELTGGADGYVSVEVSPRLAHNTDGTIEEARRLFHAIDRPNVMIKVPGTAAGIPAISALVGEGINVNVTLLFGARQYMDIAKAYLIGLKRLAETGGDLGKVASVASLFISRIDTAVDDLLPADSCLRGKIAIANAQVAYATFRRIYRDPRFAPFQSQGAKVQRILWASTSTKNPAYRDVLYVEELIGPDTVNTMPPATLEAFRDHGSPKRSLCNGYAEALELIGCLRRYEIDFDAITQRLLDEGVAAFAKSFDSLLETLARKADLVLQDA